MTKLSSGGFGKLALLFLGLSICFLSFAGSYSIDRFTGLFEQERVMLLEKQLDRAVAETESHFYQYRVLDPLIDLIRRDGPQAETIEPFARRQFSQWDLRARLYIYKDFYLVQTIPASAPYAADMGKVLQALTLSGFEQQRVQYAMQDTLAEIFGSGARLDLMKHWRHHFSSILGGEKGWFLSLLLPEGIQIMYFIDSFPGDLERFHKIPAAARETLGFAKPKMDIWSPPQEASVDDMKIAWKKATVQGGTFVRHAGRLWSFAKAQRGELWCAILPQGGASPEGALRLLIAGGYLLALLLFTGFFLSQLQTRLGEALVAPLNSLSLRRQFIALFVMVSLVPLGIAILLSSITLLEREEIIQADAHQQSTTLLLSVERSYRVVREEFRQMCHALRESPLVREVRREALASQVVELQEKLMIQNFEVRDENSRVLFSTMDPRLHGSAWLFENFCKTGIRKHAPQRLKQVEAKVSAQDIVMESLMSSADSEMTVPLRIPGKVWTLSMGGGSPTLSFWDVYPNLASGPAFVLMVAQLGWRFNAYVKELMHAGKEGDASFLARLEKKWEGSGVRTHPLLAGPEYDDLLKAAVRSQQTLQEAHRKIELRQGTYWVTLRPCLFLTNSVFMHFFPVQAQLATLAPLKWRMLLSIGSALLLAFLVSHMLANLFLLPIADLGKGIQAIGDRDIAYRIPWRRDDEFGVVVTAFNHSLHELKELQYGRVVQESLLPPKPCPPPGYEIACFRAPATDLAGDYHDIFPLPDGRWILIQGDVTGHGISAALAMAMAKATIEYQRFTGWEYPGQVLSHLNALFFRELKPRRKYMTFQCLVLDPVNHTVVYENAGHSFPLHYQHISGKAVEWEMSAPPLGFKKKWASQEMAFPLQPGDAVLLYTDGYSECFDAADNQFEAKNLILQYERCLNAGLSAQETLDELMRILDAFRAPGPYPDDVTLVLLKRAL